MRLPPLAALFYSLDSLRARHPRAWIQTQHQHCNCLQAGGGACDSPLPSQASGPSSRRACPGARRAGNGTGANTVSLRPTTRGFNISLGAESARCLPTRRATAALQGTPAPQRRLTPACAARAAARTLPRRGRKMSNRSARWLGTVRGALALGSLYTHCHCPGLQIVSP